MVRKGEQKGIGRNLRWRWKQRWISSGYELKVVQVTYLERNRGLQLEH
jgi:hypothetical protein